MYTVDMLNMGLKVRWSWDWWESHWSAQDTNKRISRTHAPTRYTHWARAQIPIDLLPPLLKPAYRHPDCVRCRHAAKMPASYGDITIAGRGASLH